MPSVARFVHRANTRRWQIWHRRRMHSNPHQADNQFGVFTVAQACHAGWSRSALKRAAIRGDLSRIRQGIYALPLAESEPHWRRHRTSLIQRAAVAALTIGSGTVSHAGAIAMHDLPLLNEGPHQPCLTLPPGFRIAERGVHLHRVRTLQWQWLGTIPVTSVARSCLDLSKEHGLHAAVAAADAAANGGSLDIAELTRRTRRCADAAARHLPGRSSS
jgi:predicted transcriptional regulator of viral defense system